MRDQPSRPPFVWLVVLVCVIYAGFFAFTAYELARHHGVVKAPGWAIRATNAGWIVSDVDAAGPAACGDPTGIRRTECGNCITRCGEYWI